MMEWRAAKAWMAKTHNSKNKGTRPLALWLTFFRAQYMYSITSPLFFVVYFLG